MELKEEFKWLVEVLLRVKAMKVESLNLVERVQ